MSRTTFFAGNACRNVVIDEIGHVVDIDQAITRGEFHASLPFLWRHLVLDRRKVGRVVHGVFLGPFPWPTGR